MISWAALERMVERRAASDPKYRKKVVWRPTRSEARKSTDEALLERLQGYGVDCDRAWLGALVRRSLSAEAIARSLKDRRDGGGERDGEELTWIWACLSVLWERWFPEEPSFEKLDDAMQAGYDAQGAGDAVTACRLWLDAWKDAVRLRGKAQVKTEEEFDELSKGTQSFFNWMQDLEMELYNAGHEDREFFRARIDLIERDFPKFGPSDDLTTENRRRSLAESYFCLGEAAKADAMYENWLKADPNWGWGWIGWSDCYRFASAEAADLKKSEDLLLKGLEVEGVRDREEIAERLADLYVDQGRRKEARKVRSESRRQSKATRISATRKLDIGTGVLRESTTVDFGEDGLPLDQIPKLHEMLTASPDLASPTAPGRPRKRKVGRNDPCPCGSGKKFKKCCGR